MTKETTKPDLSLKDFEFLSAGKLRRLEIRFNSNTSEKLHAKAAFMIDHERDDTQVEVLVSGKDFGECMEKIHDWHENYFRNIKVFGKLSGRERDPNKGSILSSN